MRKLLITIFVLFLAQTTWGAIVEIKTMNELTKYVDNNTLLIFDLDNTVVAPNQTLGSDQWYEYNVKKYEAQGLDKNAAVDRSLVDWTRVQKITKIKPVEDITPGIILKLQNSGIKTMGLTARPEDLAEATVRQLSSIGVNLGRNPVTNIDILDPSNGNFLFQYGIIFLGPKHTKGEVLVEFMKLQNLTPKKIVFVDDKAKHVKSVEKELTKLSIPYIGLRYGAADKDVKNFSKEISEVQWNVFNGILSDERAKAILTK